MKKVILGLIVVTLFGCSKTAPIIVTPIVVTPITPTQLPKIVYYGKTSYELKNTNKFINIDSLRNLFGIKNVGRWRGTNNLGFVYVDMNNDGREDIFYPYSSDGEFNTKPDVFINNGNSYTKDNSMLPTDYSGNQNTRKTIVGDFNNDSLPDIFSNVAVDPPIGVPFPYLNDNCHLLLNSKNGFSFKTYRTPFKNSRLWL
jgi:hypothetical protein